MVGPLLQCGSSVFKRLKVCIVGYWKQSTPNQPRRGIRRVLLISEIERRTSETWGKAREQYNMHNVSADAFSRIYRVSILNSFL